MTPMTAWRAVVRLERTTPPGVARPRPPAAVLAPGSLVVRRVEVDQRVGGHCHIWHGDSGVDAGGFDCELLELVPDQRPVFRWDFVGPGRRDGPAYDSLLTIALRAAPDGTTVPAG